MHPTPGPVECDGAAPGVSLALGRPPTSRSRPDTRALIRGLGCWVRNTRYLLGLSQEQLAALAGLSQGAVSRLEVGHGQETPLLTYVRTFTALCRALGPLGTATPLVPYVDHILAAAASVDPATGALPPPLADPAFARVLAAYAAMAPATQQAFLACITPLAAHLAAEGP